MSPASVVSSVFCFLLSSVAFAEFPVDQTEVQNVLGAFPSEGSIVVVASPAGSDLNQPLKIRFPATKVAGLVRMMDASDRAAVLGSTEELVLIGEIAEVSVSWANLCAHVTGDATCKTLGKKNVIVGIDSYGDGFTTGSLRNSDYKSVFEIVIIGTHSGR